MSFTVRNPTPLFAVVGAAYVAEHRFNRRAHGAGRPASRQREVAGASWLVSCALLAGISVFALVCANAWAGVAVDVLK